MTRSLRIRLIVLLGIAIVAAAAIQFAMSFRTAMAEANKLFDYHMQRMALALQDTHFGTGGDDAFPVGDNMGYDFVIQFFNNDGAHVYQSRRYRALPGQAALGFSVAALEQGDWRIYAAKTENGTVQIAQKLNARRSQAISLALHALWPILAVSVLLFIAAWWVVTSALTPLNRIGRELAERNAGSLAPVQEEGVPQEVAPLVNELNSLLDRVRQALASQQRFVADAAHELRSPLTALKLQVQMLPRAKDGAGREQAIARLGGGVDRATRLVEQLLALARQEPLAQNFTPAPVCLADCVELAAGDVLPFVLSREIDLQYGGIARTQMLGDADDLRIMARNLLDNAVRYTPEHGIVHIEITATDTGLILRIEDSGNGISAPDRSRIFDRFYRLPGTDASGAGLGLGIVKAICERHQAKITLDDAALGGLAVEIVFPLAAQS